MSSGQIVRKPLRAHERSRRTLDQRLSVRFPRLADRYLRLIGRLPPRSHLRQAAVCRGIRLAAEAFNRRDIDALLAGYHPDFEFHPNRELVEAGLAEPCYRGRTGYLKYLTELFEVWGPDIRLEPVELIDLGDRLVALGHTPGRAQASGVTLTGTYAVVGTLKDGKVIRQQDFLDHAEALEAVGLQD
jgi:ketosteroid isomerase-like protein